YTENNAEATYDIAIKVLEKGSEGDKPSEDEPQQRMLSEITVQKEKSSYEQGEMVSLDDLVVKAVYSDGSNAVVTNYTTNISSLNTVTTGKKTLIVSYYEGGITKTAEVEITVTEKKGGNGSNTSDNKPTQSETSKVLTEITVKKTKTDYYIGDTLNLNDLSITAVYSDGTQKAVNSSDCDIQLDSSYYKTNGGKMVLTEYGCPSLYVIYEENGVKKVGQISLYVQSKVKPAKVTGVKVKAKGSGKIYITWKKAKNATEYDVQIATKKNFKKGKKTNYTYNKKMTWKKLKKGKTYYVRIRAYNYQSSKYGSWSTIKKIKVK
ncbi:MAG: bacterial Ig-like domain-containing protein, partial [Lachnospiraceae bacterium]|nr:bacterial Ig-like domain-containing protein [Lachnospiraceae bacterium]